jgi:spore coat polysaccharide biosynthesis protein SpsF
MKLGAIVQARMSSQRLPGKVLRQVAGKPLLQYLLERLDHCCYLEAVVVATSVDGSDTPIADFCQELGVACCRGPLFNVAGRFKEVLEEYQFDGFVRVNGDSPLLDQRLIEEGVAIFLKGDFDLVTNVLTRTYPKGQSVEIVRGETFRAAYQFMRTEDELEHVTRHFYNHRDDFRIFNFESGQDQSGIQLSVDTPQDMDIFASIISHMNKPHWEYTLTETLRIYRGLAVI